MEVLVKLLGKVRKEIGKEEIKVSLSGPASILELFDILERELHWPFKERFIDSEKEDFRRKVIVLINDLPIRGKLKSAMLRDGDHVMLFPHTGCG